MPWAYHPWARRAASSNSKPSGALVAELLGDSVVVGDGDVLFVEVKDGEVGGEVAVEQRGFGSNLVLGAFLGVAVADDLRGRRGKGTARVGVEREGLIGSEDRAEHRA